MTDEMRKDGFNTNNSRKLSAVLTFFRSSLRGKREITNEDRVVGINEKETKDSANTIALSSKPTALMRK